MRRRVRAPQRRRVRLRWGRLAVMALLLLALAALGLAVWRSLGRPRSPFQGLLPSGTPLAVEGDLQAVLDLLRQNTPLGPAILRDFGLTRSLAGARQARLLVAVLPGSHGADPVSAENCRAAMADSVVALEEAWETRGAYPSTLPAAAGCPAGGRWTFEAAGSEFSLSCQAPDHSVRYRSDQGFLADPALPSSGPAILVALAGEAPSPRPLRAGLASRGARGVRFLCSDRRALEGALAPRGTEPGLELPGPEDAPLRVVTEGARAADLAPPILSGFLRQAGRVRLWGDPGRGRWSLETTGGTSPPGPAGADVVGALRELPAAPLALAGDPSFLGTLLPDASSALATESRHHPEVVALAGAHPLPAGDWQADAARLLAGRSPLELAATCRSTAEARRWLDATTLGRDLPWSGEDARGPGVEAHLSGGTVTLRLARGVADGGTRPPIPAGKGEARAAGWITLSSPAGSALYSWSAGSADKTCWLEISRTALAGTDRSAPPAPPVLKSR